MDTPTRRWRVQPVREDADEGGLVYVPLEETWPDWHCEHCNQLMAGREFACGYCGHVRADIDQLCG